MKTSLVTRHWPATPKLGKGGSLVTAALLFLSANAAFPQGSLTPPPGPPAPLFKTLDQIEPRTPISSLPFTISASGSYYLTTNLSISTGDAITISASNVTLDLNGFTISSTAQSATGIAINVTGTQRNIAICHGSILGSVINVGQNNYAGGGLASGIVCNAPGSTASRVNVSGMLHFGISLPTNSSVVEFCTVQSVGFDGITAQSVRHCSVNDVGQTGIIGITVSDSAGSSTGSHGIQGDTVTNSNGETSGGGAGIFAETASNCRGTSTLGAGIEAFSIESCRGASNSSVGVFVRSGGSALNCSAAASSGTAFVIDDRAAARSCNAVTSGVGFSVKSNCEITGNTATDCSTPFRISGSGNRVDGNNGSAVGGNGAFDITGSNNLIIRNSARANGNNQYPISGSANTIGTVIDVHTTGGTIANHEAWANFVY
jgi:hypothetical protein